MSHVGVVHGAPSQPPLIKLGVEMSCAVKAKLIVGPLPGHSTHTVALDEDPDRPTTLSLGQHDLLALLEEGKEYSWQAPGPPAGRCYQGYRPCMSYWLSPGAGMHPPCTETEQASV